MDCFVLRNDGVVHRNGRVVPCNDGGGWILMTELFLVMTEVSIFLSVALSLQEALLMKQSIENRQKIDKSQKVALKAPFRILSAFS